MGSSPWVEYVAREHCVEVEPSKRDPNSTQHEEIALRILGCFPNALVLEQLTKRCHGCAVDRRKVRYRRDTFRKSSRCNTRWLGLQPFFAGVRETGGLEY